MNSQSGDTRTTLGSWLTSRRTDLRLTKAEAARRAGVGRMTWFEWEDDRRLPYDSNHAGIDDAMQVERGTVAALLDRITHGEAVTATDEHPPAAPTGALTEEEKEYLRGLLKRLSAEGLRDEMRYQLAALLLEGDGVEMSPRATEVIKIGLARLKDEQQVADGDPSAQATQGDHS